MNGDFRSSFVTAVDRLVERFCCLTLLLAAASVHARRLHGGIKMAWRNTKARDRDRVEMSFAGLLQRLAVMHFVLVVMALSHVRPKWVGEVLRYLSAAVQWLGV